MAGKGPKFYFGELGDLDQPEAHLSATLPRRKGGNGQKPPRSNRGARSTKVRHPEKDGRIRIKKNLP